MKGKALSFTTYMEMPVNRAAREQVKDAGYPVEEFMIERIAMQVEAIVLDQLCELLGGILVKGFRYELFGSIWNSFMDPGTLDRVDNPTYSTASDFSWITVSDQVAMMKETIKEAIW